MNEKITLVIPTIRENCFKDFVHRWRAIGLFDNIDRFIVMEDNPKKTFKVEADLPRTQVDHFCWEDITELLGDREWVVPRRSDTVRSFGYLEAFLGRRRGRDDRDPIHCDYVLTLDDDCYPPTGKVDGLEYDGKGFLRAHIDAMEGRSRWFNTLTSVKPRGIPFYNIGKSEIVLNHGLWTNVLDYDAPYQLANPIEEEFAFDTRVVPSGFYFPMCGMNVMWKRDITVLMYHLLMGKRKAMLDTVPNTDKDGLVKLPFDRFGDIWCGIFMKKIADMRRLSVSTGMPYIRHERASNPFTNLKKEANGIEVNEDLWEHVDKFFLYEDDQFGLSYVYKELGKHIMTFVEKYPKYKEYDEYFLLLGKAMVQWAELFEDEGLGRAE